MGGDGVRIRVNTAQIDVIALARSPDDLVASLRAAKARYSALAAAAMERSDAQGYVPRAFRVYRMGADGKVFEVPAGSE